MILNDSEIAKLCTLGVDGSLPMLEPFRGYETKNRGVISRGLTSFGYDLTLDTWFRVVPRPTLLERIRNLFSAPKVIDPKNIDPTLYKQVFRPDFLDIPPHSFALGMSIEYIRIPDDVVGVCLGKSTYARCGLDVNITPLEPGWEGKLTIELTNNTPHYLRVYVREGIAQVLFFRGNRPNRTYAEKGGVYQGQTDVTLPRVKQTAAREFAQTYDLGGEG